MQGKIQVPNSQEEVVLSISTGGQDKTLQLLLIHPESSLDMKTFLREIEEEKVFRTGLKLWNCETLLSKLMLERHLPLILKSAVIAEISAGFSGLCLQFIMKQLQEYNQFADK